MVIKGIYLEACNGDKKNVLDFTNNLFFSTFGVNRIKNIQSRNIMDEKGNIKSVIIESIEFEEIMEIK